MMHGHSGRFKPLKLKACKNLNLYEDTRYSKHHLYSKREIQVEKSLK